MNLGLRGKYGWAICGNTLSREVQLLELTAVRVKGIAARMQDEQILEMLEEHGFAAGDVDFVLAPRHTASSKSTSFGYFFANCRSSMLAAGLIDVCKMEGLECAVAPVQGFDVNVVKFYNGHRAGQAWISQAGVWQKVVRT